MDSRAYWIWLSSCLGAGARVDTVLAAYPTARELYEAGPSDWRLSGVFSNKQINQLCSVEPERAKVNIDLCNKNGWHIVTPEDSEYPALLSDISSPPLVLYVWGDLSFVNDTLPLAVVGTRNPVRDSETITRKLCCEMAAAGVTIVSGGALGIDSAAHDGALNGGGKTVSVLGCGLGERYLSRNAELFSQISKNGAVISEFAPFASATTRTFPIRNRIISGMSRGTLVVEAGERSGSLITAHFAADQGRDIFAVPGNIVSSAYVGANRLIRDGAKAVTCAEDILNEYSLLYPDMINIAKLREKSEELSQKHTSPVFAAPKPKTAISGVSPTAARVYEFISYDPIHTDDIIINTGLPVGDVVCALTELELSDYIVALPGKLYTVK